MFAPAMRLLSSESSPKYSDVRPEKRSTTAYDAKAKHDGAALIESLASVSLAFAIAEFEVPARGND